MGRKCRRKRGCIVYNIGKEVKKDRDKGEGEGKGIMGEGLQTVDKGKEGGQFV